MGWTITKFTSSEGNVWKYVFDMGDAIAEAVLYRYSSFQKRTVICCSVQSGCPVGCKFCGTGKRFVRDLTSEEIIQQIHYIVGEQEILPDYCEKFQIMFMSMGEPMLNWKETKRAIQILNVDYPKAELLISTMGTWDFTVFMDIVELSKKIDQVGLQFSIHQSTDEKRGELITYSNRAPLATIRDYGLLWWKHTGRNPFLNYCVSDLVDGVWNDSLADADNLTRLFSPIVFRMTCSVVCSAEESMKKASINHLERVQTFANLLSSFGWDVRVFDPAGQDDIGGGCGQLWFVQEWFKKREQENKGI